MMHNPVFIVSMVVLLQFFALVLVFSFWPSQMSVDAKTIVLQTYVVAFTSVLGFWIGSSIGSKNASAALTSIAAKKE